MGIKIIRNNKLWMEEEAILHLEKIAHFDGVEDVVGLPDLHESTCWYDCKIKGCNISVFNW